MPLGWRPSRTFKTCQCNSGYDNGPDHQSHLPSQKIPMHHGRVPEDCPPALMGRFPSLPSRPKLLQKSSLHRKCFEAINFVKIAKESLYKTNSLACFLARRDTPVAATLQRKSFGGIIFVIITNKITKIIVPGNYFVIISAKMVMGRFPTLMTFPDLCLNGPFSLLKIPRKAAQ